MKKYLTVLLLTTLVGFWSGCVTQLKSTVAPGADLKALKKVYVVHLPADARGVDRLIADRLALMGIVATTGEKSAVPEDVEATVTYQDKWTWDITMYMIQLDVQIRRPKTDSAIASGHSLRTSLVRKSPVEMVDQVLTDIFKQGQTL